MECSIQSGDIGTILEVTFKVCETGSIEDISSATVKKINIFLPDLTVVEKTAIFTTNGTDGKIQYATVSGDLDQVGRYKIQGFVETLEGSWSSTIDSFNVVKNL